MRGVALTAVLFLAGCATARDLIREQEDLHARCEGPCVTIVGDRVLVFYDQDYSVCLCWAPSNDQRPEKLQFVPAPARQQNFHPYLGRL